MATSKFNRRDFLKRCATSTVAGAGAYASLSSLNMMSAMAQAPSDYKALVCVFMLGGNDSYNMFMPRTGSAYNEYSEARQNLAVPQADILAADGTDFGFHPAMPEVQSLFNQGNLAVTANVGSLIVPTTRDQFKERSVPLPNSLFSHNDQQDIWQGIDERSGAPLGWSGRMADLLDSVNGNQNLSMNISLSGANVMQVGEFSIPYSLSSRGSVPSFDDINRTDTGELDQKRVEIFDRLMAAPNNSLLVEEYARVATRADALSLEVSNALAGVADPQTEFPESRLAGTLKTVAKTIAARNTLNMSRQIFFVGIGGWDTHDNQLNKHPDLLSEVSQAMSAFYGATEEMGLQDNITTFTAADFGRTLTSNGDGTDHGWGSHQLMMGGAVRGKQVYGEMPPMVIEGPQDSGRGRIIPTTSIEQYNATLARWFGLSASQVAELFPNLGNFDAADLGFMG